MARAWEGKGAGSNGSELAWGWLVDAHSTPLFQKFGIQVGLHVVGLSKVDTFSGRGLVVDLVRNYSRTHPRLVASGWAVARWRGEHATDTKGNFVFDRTVTLDRSQSVLDRRRKR